MDDTLGKIRVYQVCYTSDPYEPSGTVSIHLSLASAIKGAKDWANLPENSYYQTDKIPVLSEFRDEQFAPKLFIDDMTYVDVEMYHIVQLIRQYRDSITNVEVQNAMTRAANSIELSVGDWE